MQTSTSKVRLKFRCDQDEAEMQVGSDGKPFCELCQRSLTDFRAMPLPKVLDYVNNNTGCGIFDVNHVEPEEYVIFSINSFKHYLLAIGTFFIAETSNAQATIDSFYPKSEIIDSNHAEDNITQKVKSNSEPKVKNNRVRFTRKSGITIEYGLFAKKKFPFIVFRRKVYPRSVKSFWHEQFYKENPPKKNGILFFKIRKK